jgi:hypothetical protein
MKTKKVIRSQSGQSILEYLIVLSVIIFSWQAISRGIKQSDFFGTVFGQPWARMENVIEFGVPASDRKNASRFHPTYWGRHSTKTKRGGA